MAEKINSIGETDLEIFAANSRKYYSIIELLVGKKREQLSAELFL